MPFRVIIYCMNNLSYYALKNKIENFKNVCHNHGIIGHSFTGEPIYYFHIGSSSGIQILIEAGIHAREYISTLATLKEMEALLNASTLSFGVYFVPLMNPDGVGLVLDGLDYINNSDIRNFLLKINNSKDFSLWKANARGVDLNVNFNAMWGLGKHNTFSPGPQNFVGEHPLSEPESLTLSKFLAQHKIDGSLSIHTKGEVVYYGYDRLSPAELARDKLIATHLAEFLGITPEKTIQSVGGVSDYISEIYHIPSFTIELGSDKLTHPITPDYLDIVSKNFVGISSRFADLLLQNI